MAIQALHTTPRRVTGPDMKAFGDAFDRAQNVALRLETVLGILSEDIDEIHEAVAGNPRAAHLAERLLGTHMIAADYRDELARLFDTMLKTRPADLWREA